MKLNILFIFLSISMVACTKDLSKKEPYAKAIGKHFILQKNMYLYQFHDSRSHSWPPMPCELRVGYITPDDTFFNNLPEVIEEKYIGAKNSYVTIKGILRKGSTFTVNRVVEQKTLDHYYYFYLISPEEGPFANQEIEPSDIVNIFENPPYSKTWSDPPIFESKYALPLPSDSIWWK